MLRASLAGSGSPSYSTTLKASPGGAVQFGVATLQLPASPTARSLSTHWVVAGPGVEAAALLGAVTVEGVAPPDARTAEAATPSSRSYPHELFLGPAQGAYWPQEQLFFLLS